MSNLPGYDRYQPAPKPNSALTDKQLARDRFRHVWPVLFIFGGITFLWLIAFVALLVGTSYELAIATMAIPLFCGYKVYLTCTGTWTPL